jgi:DNA repair exonuclease SbcCD ATPase subunit
MSSSASKPQLDCLIHLGAGRCSELDQHLAREPGRLVLVEADEGLADKLRQRVPGRSNVQVVNTAIAAETGQRTYYRYNLPAVNGLREPTGLCALYPGLRVLEARPVQAMGIIEFLDSLQPAADQSNGLVIELAGEEAAILEALEAGDRLHQFCELELVASREPLYELEKPARELLDWLDDQGFLVVEEDDRGDQDRPRWRLSRDDRMLEIAALRSKNAQLLTERDEQKARADQGWQEIEALRQAHSELTEQLRLAEERLGQREAELHEEAERRVAELTAERDQKKARADQSEKDIEALRQAQSELTEQVHVAEARLGQREAELHEEAEQRVAELTAERDRAMSDLAVAIRMQAIRDTDLKELQSRYADAVELRDQQQELLVKLQRRLGGAAAFLRKLEAQPVEATDGALTGEIIRALAGSDDSKTRSDPEPQA